MSNKSIAYRLTLFISLAVITVFITFIIANYLFNQKLIRENNVNRAIVMSMEVSALVNSKVFTTAEVTENIAEQFIYYGTKGDEQVLLSGIVEKYPFIKAIHVHIDSAVPLQYKNFYAIRGEDGDINVGQGNRMISCCDKEREIYDEIKDLTASDWTDPFLCPKKGTVVAANYAPIFYHGEDGKKIFAGQVVIELSLTELNDAINTMKNREKGYAFLITRDGDYITHPNDSNILKRNLYSLPSRMYDNGKLNPKDILQEGKSGWATIYPDILDFQKSWVYYTPINENRWFLIFVMPYRALFAPLYWITARMLTFALLGIILTYLIIKYITKSLVNPLTDVTSKLTALSGVGSNGDNTLNEVKQVSDTLEYLNEWFDHYRIASEQEEVKSLRRKQALQQASEIQQSLIKLNYPAFPNRKDIDLFVAYKPARIVSGDLFDYFLIDNENLVFTIGDVSGKGVPAAIFMSVAQTIIRNKANALKKAKEIVAEVNVELSTSNRHQYFLTLFLGVLNLRTGGLNCCNAAHDFPFILKSDGNIEELREAHGLPLGLYPDRGYKESIVKIEKGDTIVLYTDGVTEQLDSQKNQYGEVRLKENLRKMAKNSLTPFEMVKKIEDDLDVFRGNSPQTDDVCLYTLRYNP
ncbi:serine phosphatase [Mariniphaga anaerophila]|uniref:Serine phosphatase n=1 Tax=Mariniphaga anaerophila TaxID=1484053 RepID=A0A1M4SY99_9BACT|nr:SpoIIE family protein phosphatase [Mariniphaga anaerophila]SHE37206.1 serine phosphatase [Mariniphaga anaerophila]